MKEFRKLKLHSSNVTDERKRAQYFEFKTKDFDYAGILDTGVNQAGGYSKKAEVDAKIQKEMDEIRTLTLGELKNRMKRMATDNPPLTGKNIVYINPSGGSRKLSKLNKIGQIKAKNELKDIYPYLYTVCEMQIRDWKKPHYIFYILCIPDLYKIVTTKYNGWTNLGWELLMGEINEYTQGLEETRQDKRSVDIDPNDKSKSKSTYVSKKKGKVIRNGTYFEHVSGRRVTVEELESNIQIYDKMDISNFMTNNELSLPLADVGKMSVEDLQSMLMDEVQNVEDDRMKN
jgi:hypothetical protein